VNDVGEPCAGEPLARFDAAAGGNPGQSASPCGPGSLPPTLHRGSRPEEWKPPSWAAWCLCARWWIDVKRVWRLAVTVAEKGAPGAMLATC